MVNKPGKRKIGLILTGGGARAAYQVGVLKAIAQMLPKDASNPFPILCGSSAGAINATALAIYARRFNEGVRRLNYVWKNFHVHQVFRADALGVFLNGVHWLAAIMLGGLGKYSPQALLDRSPLRTLLEKFLPCAEIQASIDAGAVHALSVTASGYGSGQSVTFFQGIDTLMSWKRVNRVGCAANITIDHLMASSAIPFVFAPIKINREYFGDGSMRQTAPVSPALHLGAERVVVIGVRPEQGEYSARPDPREYPSLAQVAGHVLNSIFLDSLEADLERLRRINKTVSLIPSQYLQEGAVRLRKVEPLVISPSQDVEKIAARYVHYLPRPVRFLLRGLGALNRRGSNLVSYVLFEKPYCRELISLGYADAMMRRHEIMDFLDLGGDLGVN